MSKRFVKLILNFCLLSLLGIAVFGCKRHNGPASKVKHRGSSSANIQSALIASTDINTIGEIRLPEGYTRLPIPGNPFGCWIRKLRLKKSNLVYLFNHQLKADQSSHYAVVDISTGERDLQQCADALMRLRAEYLFSVRRYGDIHFLTGDGKRLSFSRYANGERYTTVGHNLTTYTINKNVPCYEYRCLSRFMISVFNFCSTYSLKLMCKQKATYEDIQPGDVFVKAGSPGHAMMVADVAVNVKTGEKIFMLLQGFMPAQDIHIVRNVADRHLSPWYKVSGKLIDTPGWTFSSSDLRQW